MTSQCNDRKGVLMCCYDGKIEYDGRFGHQKACNGAFWVVDCERQGEIWEFKFANGYTVRVNRTTFLNCYAMKGKLSSASFYGCTRGLYMTAVFLNGVIQDKLGCYGNSQDVENILRKTEAIVRQ